MLRLDPDMSALRPCVPMATMDIIRTHARRTVTTVLIGSRVVCLLALVLGIADTMDPASIDQAFTPVRGMDVRGMVRDFIAVPATATTAVADMRIVRLADSQPASAELDDHCRDSSGRQRSTSGRASFHGAADLLELSTFA